MSRIQKRLIVMLLGIGAVGAMAYVALKPPGESSTTLSKPLLGSEDLKKLEVKIGERAYTLEKQKRGWVYIEGTNRALADAQRVEGLLSTLRSAPIHKTFKKDEEPKPKDTGLDTSAAQVSIFTSENTARISFGRVSPFNKQLYARRDDRVIMTSANILRLIQQREQLWLEQELTGLDVNLFEQMTVTLEPSAKALDTQPVDIDIVRSEVQVELKGIKMNRGFVLRAPKLDGFDADAIRSIVAVTHSVRLIPAPVSEGFVPFVTLRFFTKDDDAPHEIVLSQPVPLEGGEDVVFVRRARDTMTFRVSPQILDFVLKSKASLQTNRVLLIDSTSVHAVELKSSTFNTLSLERTPRALGVDPGWKILGKAERKADARVVNGMLVGTSAIRGERVSGVDVESQDALRAYGLDDKSVRRIVYKIRDGRVLAELHLGKEEGDSVFARRAGASFISKVPKRVSELFPKSVANLLAP